MFRFLNRFVGHNVAKNMQKPEDLEPNLYRELVTTGCTHCDLGAKGRAMRYLEGPEAGAAQNVWCYYCGTRYNIVVFDPHNPSLGGYAEVLKPFERQIELELHHEVGTQALAELEPVNLKGK